MPGAASYLFFAVCGLTLGLAACAPPGPAKTASGDTADDSAGPSSEGRKKPRRTQSLEESHEQFIHVCVKSADMQPYCDCGWGVMTKMFSAEEMAADDVNDVRMTKLKLRVTKECARKMPEPQLREAFVKGCKKDDAQLDGYCGCMWTQLRTAYSAGDLAQPEIVKEPKFKAGVASGGKTCSAKLPESSVKKAFFEGCAKTPQHNAFCGCAWKALRVRASLGEIQSASDTPEMKVTLRDVGQRCARFLPGADRQ